MKVAVADNNKGGLRRRRWPTTTEVAVTDDDGGGRGRRRRRWPWTTTEVAVAAADGGGHGRRRRRQSWLTTMGGDGGNDRQRWLEIDDNNSIGKLQEQILSIETNLKGKESFPFYLNEKKIKGKKRISRRTNS